MSNQVDNITGQEIPTIVVTECPVEISSNGKDEGLTPLQFASKHGDESAVRSLLESGATDTAIALQLACHTARRPIVQLLLEHGAEINKLEGFYGTALQAACSCETDNKHIIEQLLEGGADVNASGGHYGYALQAAAFAGRPSEVKLLLEAGANVNAVGGSYGTALQVAAGRGHDAVVRELIHAGAEVNVTDDNGFGATALQGASWNGHHAIVKHLLEYGANVNAPGEHFGPALHAASHWGWTSVVELLLDHGADINQRGQDGGTALKAASGGGNIDTVELLVDRGADIICLQDEPYHIDELFGDVDYRDSDRLKSSDALRVAALNGHEDVFKLLLARSNDAYRVKGESFYFEELYGEEQAKVSEGPKHYNGLHPSALEAAILGNHETIVALLLDAGADPNTSYIRGGTALDIACHTLYQPIVELLLARGASPARPFQRHIAELFEQQNYEALASALTCAVRRDSTSGSAPSDKEHSMHTAFDTHDAALLEHHLTTLQTHLRPETLRWAVVNNKPTFVSFLLAHDAPLARLDEYHRKTALHWAAEHGHDEIVQSLLTLGAAAPAILNCQDRYGETALHYAAENGHKHVVHHLVNAGADWTLLDEPFRFGRTPLKCAKDRGHFDVAEYLELLVAVGT